MATQANPWDADPVVSTGKNPWDADPVVASPAAPARASNPRLDKITSFATETDKLLGLTPGTSLAQLTQESRLRDDATSPVGAEGVAQVMPTTKATLERRLGRPLNSRNTDDALLIHREVMRENMQKFGNRDDALRAYNAGWDKNRWGNPETSAYVDKINGRMGIPAAEGAAYKPFATIRKDIDQKTLNVDPDWLKASALLYELWEKKPYEGKSQDDLAEWGKDRLGYFNFNTIDMGRIAYAVSKGSQEQKEAFLYMMDTYDETDISWAGAGRAAKGVFTDPLNLVGLGTMGIGFGAKMAARNASKEAAKLLVKRSMVESVKDAVVTGAVRTGVVAGMEGAIYGGAQSVVKQGVEVSAGRREEVSVGKTAVDAATGAAAGLVLGTGLDVVASKALPPAARAVNNIRDMFRGTPNTGVPSAANRIDPVFSEDISGVTPKAPADTFSGTIPGVHGSELPLEKLTVGSAVPEEIRYDGNGGVWGDGFYSAEKGDYSWFRGGDIRMTDYTNATEVSSTFNKAAVLTPETTIGLFEKLGLKGVEFEGDLVKALKDQGYDGVIVRGFDGDAAAKTVEALQAKGILGPDLRGNGFEAALMNQVVHFTPEKGVKVGAADSTLGPLMESRREIAAEIDKKVKAAGYSYLNDAQYIVKKVEEYAGKDDAVSKSNYEYVKKQYGDQYEEAKKFLDSISDLLKKRDEVNGKISELANSPKKVSANDNLPNLGSNLTPDEILAAQARQQDGRLPADEVAPDMTGAPDNLITLPNIENTGGRTTRVNGEPVAKVTKADVEAQSQTIIDQLRAQPKDSLPIALEQLRTGRRTDEEKRVIDAAVRLYSDELAVAAKEAVIARDALLGKTNRTPAEELRLQEVTAQADEVLARMATPTLTDDSFGSMAGTMLSDRRNAGPGASKITVESIMTEKGVTRDEALTLWAEVIAKLEQDTAIQKVADGYEVKIAAARDAGDMDEVARLSVQKGREMAAMGENITPGAASYVEKLKELSISNVFSPKTVQLNVAASTIKALSIPSLKFVFGDDFSRAARAELVGTYAAMRSSFSGAFGGAKMVWRVEQSLLTRDVGRLSEGELALSDTNKAFKWLPAGAIRFFPRILSATDEFLSRVAYDGYVAGKASYTANVEGYEKGLRGKDLSNFVREAGEKAVEESRQITKGEDLVQPLINKGTNKGLTGDELWDWVEKEAMRDPDAFRKATDEEAVAYINDVLYKKDFSGVGRYSKLAQIYEKGSKAVPEWSLVTGQFFFRTLVRVFEEGVRLTPGIQFLAPNFFNDLSGKNGMARQVRAQAESMTSLATAAAVVSLYSQGRITGDLSTDNFQQQRISADGRNPPKYSIQLSDGSWWSYQTFDPIATPMKIMINALERADKLKLKQSQGEDIPDSKIQEAVSHLSVGVMAVLVAIKDANLVTGARITGELFSNAEDFEKNEDKFLKFLGEKLFLLVPNTLHKLAKDNDPSIRDPADFWQMVNEKIARPLGLGESIGIVTSKSYDFLGNVRRPADTGALWNMAATVSQEELERGRSEKSLRITDEIDFLRRTTGATFKTPVKHPSLGDLDLRTVAAKDGKRTLYDVWQDNYKALKPEEPLYELATSDLPTGTFKNRGIKAAAMQTLAGKLQEAAFAQLRVDEGDVINAQIDKVLRTKALSMSGAFDSKRP